MEQLRREKVDLENSLEHEQEALFNTLGKRMDQLEAEKRRLQNRLDEVDGVESEAADGGRSNSAEIAAPSTSASEVIVNNPPRISRATNLNSLFSTSAGTTCTGTSAVPRLMEATSVTAISNSNNNNSANVSNSKLKSSSKSKILPSSPLVFLIFLKFTSIIKLWNDYLCT